MKILPLFIPHAGCRHDCLFCNQKSTSLNERIPGPEAVEALVKKALRHGILDEVAYYGGSFTALPVEQQESLLAVLQSFLQRNDIGGIRISTRPDAIDDDIVDLLRCYGVTTVELGCQSFDDAVLNAAGRGHTVADAVKAVTCLQHQNFRLGLQLMPGLPGAGVSEALSSLTMALRLSPDFLRVYPTVVLAGTQLAESWKVGTYCPLSLDEAVDICADIEIVCRDNAVPVIRYGLQANEALDSDAVLAGPYHPAFGQLVRSRLWSRALGRLREDGINSIHAHPSDLSDAYGHGKKNINQLQQKGRFSIATAPHVRRGTIDTGHENFCLYGLAAGKDC